MKRGLLLMLILLSGYAHAQYDQQHAVKIQPLFSMGFPIGNFNTKNNNSLITGRAKTGYGGGLVISVPAYKDLYAGFAFTAIDYKLDDNAIQNNLSGYYADTNYFVTVKSNFRIASISYISLHVAYNIRMGLVEVSPYVRTGLGLAQYMGGGGVDRKLKNNNYSENISITTDYKIELFLPYVIGVNVQLPIRKWVYFTIGAHYASGKASMRFYEEKKTFLGEQQKRTFGSFTQSFSSIQTELGLQVRMWRKARSNK